MATEVSRQIKSEAKPGSGGPVTRDFMGGCLGSDSKELDLDLHVPTGWEKRLDLQSGKVYIQRCISPSSNPDQKNKNSTNQTAPSSSTFRVQKVNFHQETTPNLDLKLFSNSPSNALPIHENATYQSVCTLEKVRSALERARKMSSQATTSSSKKRASSPSNSNSDSSMISITNTNTTNTTTTNNNNNDDSNSNSSSRDRNATLLRSITGNNFFLLQEENVDNRMMVAGACPSCLLYVLISKTNPKCPKCNSVVPLTTPSKKPKIDLNI